MKKKHAVRRKEEGTELPPRGVCILVPDEPGMIQLSMKIVQAIDSDFAETLEVSVLPYSAHELMAPNQEVGIPEKIPHLIILVTVRDDFRPLLSWISEWGANTGVLISPAGMEDDTQSLVIKYTTHHHWMALVHKGTNSAVPAFLADAVRKATEHVKIHTPDKCGAL